MNINILLAVGACLLLVGVVLTKLSRHLNVPALLFFMVVGMLAGSEGPGGIVFENYAVTRDIGLVALALILFAGGLDTSARTLTLGIRPAASLATFGVLVTALVLGACAAWLLGWSLLEGMLLGSIVGSTDAAAVFLILRNQNVKLPRRVESTLEVEAGINDPMAVFLTVSLTDLLVKGAGVPLGTVLANLGYQAAAAGLIGGGMGFVGARMLNRIRLDSPGLYPVMTLAIGLGTFGLTNAAGGSGFAAVYLAGVMIGRDLTVAQRSIIDFHDGLAWLMQIVMFIALGLLSFPSHLVAVADQGLILSAVLIVLARPVAVALSLAAARFSVREHLLIAWVGLRGAVPIILATFPVLAGLPHGKIVFNITFFVVVTSVLFQGTTISWVASRLGLQRVRRPKPLHRLHITSIEQTDRHIKSYYLDATSHVVWRAIKDLPLPPEVFIAMIVRDGQVLAPQGHTQLDPGDHLFILCRASDHADLRRLFDAAVDSGSATAR